MKIGLGTVQYGLNYGIVNESGQVTNDEVKRIFDFARQKGIQFLDTAPAYGASEKVLGGLLEDDHPFNVITKTITFEDAEIGSVQVERLKAAFEQSLENLGQASVYGLLVHDAEDIKKKGFHFIAEVLRGYRENSLVKKIGVSVYDSGQIDYVLDHFPIDLIQIPISVLDQRLIGSGHLKKLKGLGVEIHARSVFLQGVLLSSPSELPAFLDGIRIPLDKFRQTAESQGLTPLEAAFGFVRDAEEVDLVLCGIRSKNELEQLVDASEKELDSTVFRSSGLDDPNMIDPSNWPADVS